MIYVKSEDRVEIRGNTETVMLETAIAGSRVYELLYERSDEETAKEGIALIGRIAMDIAKAEEGRG